MATPQFNTGNETSRAAGELSEAPLSERNTTLALVLILAVVFLAYADTLWFGFVHDDRYQILGNTWLRAWKYFPLYFTRDVWAFEHPVIRGTFYRPIFLVWFRVQYLLFGTQAWGWHLCTVLCHLGVTLLVFFTAKRLLQDRLGALFATLIFGLHPIHADAVAWISGVTESLFALFLIASYLCYLKMRAEAARAHRYLLASMALYALACLSKETAVVLPVIIFGSELIWSKTAAHPSGRTWLGRFWGAFTPTIPFLALTAIYLVVRVEVLQGFQNTKEEHALTSMFLTWPAALWFYLHHLIWPTRLSPFYLWDYCTRLDVRHVVLPAIPVLAAAVGLWVWAKKSSKAAVAVLWLIVPILPALDLRAFIERHLVHDRYLYLPSFGLALLAALAIRHIKWGTGRLLGQPALQLALVAIIGTAMGTEVVQGTACYANQMTYFMYSQSMLPAEQKSDLDLADFLGQQGHLDEAIKIYRRMLSRQPNDWPLNYNLGYASYLSGNLPDAEVYLGRATQIDSSRPDAFFYLGLTKLKMGDLNAAAANVQRAVTIRPDADHYHFALGVILKLQGNLAGALTEFHQEMDLDPSNATAREEAAKIEAAPEMGK